MVKSISKQEVQQKQEENIVVKLIDIRTAEEYETRHVKGATHFPADQLTSEPNGLGKDDTIVCICNHGKERSQQAAERLSEAGFKNIYYLEGGTSGWYNE